jgi:hypothetical protein
MVAVAMVLAWSNVSGKTFIAAWSSMDWTAPDITLR